MHHRLALAITVLCGIWTRALCILSSTAPVCQRPRGHSSTAGEVVRGLLVTLAEETGRAQHPANTRHWTNAGFMLGQRRRQWPNFNPALAQSAKGSWTKKAAAAYLNSKQLLPFGFAHTYHCGGDKCSSSYPHPSNDRAEATGGATSANYSQGPPPPPNLKTSVNWKKPDHIGWMDGHWCATWCGFSLAAIVVSV